MSDLTGAPAAVQPSDEAPDPARMREVPGFDGRYLMSAEGYVYTCPGVSRRYVKGKRIIVRKGGRVALTHANGSRVWATLTDLFLATYGYPLRSTPPDEYHKPARTVHGIDGYCSPTITPADRLAAGQLRGRRCFANGMFGWIEGRRAGRWWVLFDQRPAPLLVAADVIGLVPDRAWERAYRAEAEREARAFAEESGMYRARWQAAQYQEAG